MHNLYITDTNNVYFNINFYSISKVKDIFKRKRRDRIVLFLFSFSFLGIAIKYNRLVMLVQISYEIKLLDSGN